MDLSNEWCRRRDSNSRPRDYETLALPLSYTGKNKALHVTDAFQGLSSKERVPETNSACPSQLELKQQSSALKSLPIEISELIEKQELSAES